MPFGDGHRFLTKGPLSHVFNGFQWSGDFTIGSGFYFTPRVLGAQLDINRGVSGSQRANVLPGAPISLSNPTTAEWFNTAAYCTPGPGCSSSTGTTYRRRRPLFHRRPRAIYLRHGLQQNDRHSRIPRPRAPSPRHQHFQHRLLFQHQYRCELAYLRPSHRRFQHAPRYHARQVSFLTVNDRHAHLHKTRPAGGHRPPRHFFRAAISALSNPRLRSLRHHSRLLRKIRKLAFALTPKSFSSMSSHAINTAISFAI